MKNWAKLAIAGAIVVTAFAAIGAAASGGADAPSVGPIGSGVSAVAPTTTTSVATAGQCSTYSACDAAGRLQTPTTVSSLPTSTIPQGPRTVFGDGVYEVGVDIQPGRYKTAGPDKNSVWPMCYWARLRDDSGELRAIIANDNIPGAGSMSVAKTDKFVEFSTGCTWTKQ